MIVKETIGKTERIYERKFVLVCETCDELYCEGIFDDYYTAVGKAYTKAFEWKDSTFQNEGDSFEVSDFESRDSDGGVYMIAKGKVACWSEPCEDIWHILFEDTLIENYKGGDE